MSAAKLLLCKWTGWLYDDQSIFCEIVFIILFESSYNLNVMIVWIMLNIPQTW